jgi:hypothetical protein
MCIIASSTKGPHPSCISKPHGLHVENTRQGELQRADTRLLISRVSTTGASVIKEYLGVFHVFCGFFQLI